MVFLTGHDDTGDVPQAVDWNAVANAAPVVVMYMAVKHLTSIATRLVAAGRNPDERLAVVCNAALPDQYVVEATLGTAATIADRITAPAIVVLGPVSRYRETLDWYVGSLRENTIG